MKLHETTMAPNCRRVRVFLSEKGIEVPLVPVDVGKGENRRPEFRKMNPLGTVPVLELDDGTFIAESVAICRYFEEQQPDPPLMGVGARDRAVVEMWSRRAELEVFVPIAQVFRNTHEFFEGRIEQSPEFGAICRRVAEKRLQWLDGELAGRDYLAGDRFSIADITALVAIDFGRVSKLGIPDGLKSLKRWHEAVSSRPSARA